MALKGIDIYAIKDEVSEHDPDKKNPTTYKLGVLDNRILAELEDGMTSFEIGSGGSGDSAKTTLAINRRAIEFFRFGVKGIENFQDSKGKPVKFETISVAKFGTNYNVVAPHIVQMHELFVIKEMAAKIRKYNRLTEEEEKN